MLQTTYLKIVTGKARFEGRSSLKTWLFGVIRRTAQEASRRAQSEGGRVIRLVKDDLEDPLAESPDQKLARAEAASALVRAMEKLSERQREVLHLVFYQDLSISEASEVLGISLGSARTHYQRGKDRLREVLAEDEHVA